MENDDLVWAKWSRFIEWPGKICSPQPSLTKPTKKPSKWIFFFGTKDHAWVEVTKLRSYVKNRDAIVKKIKQKKLKEAVKRIDDYLSDREKFKDNADFTVKQEVEDTDTAFDKLRESDDSPELEAPKRIPAKNAVKKPPAKKKSEPKSKTKRMSGNNTEFNSSASKRARRSSKDEPRPQRTRELGPQVLGEEPPQISMNISRSQNIVASAEVYGFLFDGILRSVIVKNLLNSGHRVIIWNPDPSNSTQLEEDMGAEVAETPHDVVDKVDIIFLCFSDRELLLDFITSCGITKSNQYFNGKGYVEMTGLDSDTSQDIAHAIVSRGGRYLEAPVQGSRVQAEEGTLIILAAGDRTLFDECESCFKAIGTSSFFLGDVGNASAMYMVLQMSNNVIEGLSQSFAIDRRGVQKNDLLEVLEVSAQLYR